MPESSSNKLVRQIRFFKLKVRNKPIFKWWSTMITVVCLILYFLSFALNNSYPLFSSRVIKTDNNGIRDFFLLFFILIPVFAILIFSIWKGFGKVFKILASPFLAVRTLLNGLLEVLIELIPQKWESHLKPSVIRRGTIGFLTILNALVFSVVRVRLETSTRLFFKAIYSHTTHLSDFQIDWGVTFFWILLISSLIFSLFHHGREELDQLKKQSKTLGQIKSAILKVPNEELFKNYPIWFDEIKVNCQSIVKITKQPRAEDLSEVELALQKDDDFYKTESLLLSILSRIKDLAYEFYPEKDSAQSLELCANIMIYFPSNFEDQVLIKSCYKRNGIYPIDKYPLDALKGFYLFDEILSVNTDDFTPPLTIIPILGKGKREVPFGVLRAHREDISYEGDIKQYLSEINSYNYYDQKFMSFFTRNDEAQNYGRRIQSQFSCRIGSKDDPVGMVNIHSSSKNHLGLHELYFPAFSALFTPIARELVETLLLYRKGYSD